MTDNPERQRLRTQREGREDWRLWGPNLAERAGRSVPIAPSGVAVSTPTRFATRG